jgi:hypothetical protein
MKVILQAEKLGLKKHLLQCGDLVENYDAVIVLEDDLYVAKGFFDFAQQAYSFYKDDEQIAGIGLYNYRYNEYAHCPFEPLTDGYDNYFMQVPCSWGQMWTREHWQSFKAFLAKDSIRQENRLLIPEAVHHWPKDTSWKRKYFSYIVATDKYFVYPRIALSTNFGEPGAHFPEPLLVWQTPLLIGAKPFRFSTLEESQSIYDSFLELDPKAFQRLTKDERSISFDLNGTKPLHSINTEYLVSSKRCLQPEITYQPALYPYECNVLLGLKGTPLDSMVFSLGKTTSFKDELRVLRLDLDVKRTLPHMTYVLSVAKEEVRITASYRLGNYVLSTLRIPSKVYGRIKRIFGF